MSPRSHRATETTEKTSRETWPRQGRVACLGFRAHRGRGAHRVKRWGRKSLESGQLLGCRPLAVGLAGWLRRLAQNRRDSQRNQESVVQRNLKRERVGGQQRAACLPVILRSRRWRRPQRKIAGAGVFGKLLQGGNLSAVGLWLPSGRAFGPLCRIVAGAKPLIIRHHSPTSGQPCAAGDSIQSCFQ